MSLSDLNLSLSSSVWRRRFTTSSFFILSSCDLVSFLAGDGVDFGVDCDKFVCFDVKGEAESELAMVVLTNE